GRTIAKEAKRLEKMKSKNGKYSAVNSRIDEKLDKLFGYQEQLTAAKTKPRYAFGGTIPPIDPEKPTKKTVLGPEYIQSNHNNSEEQKQTAATLNLNKAMMIKRSLTGSEGTLVPTADTELIAQSQHIPLDKIHQPPGGSRRSYEFVDP